MNNDKDDQDLHNILNVIRKETGIDFNHYKMPTIKRRIARRMMFHRLKTMIQYSELLAKQPDEIPLLCQEMLIHVTEFFRDNATHQYLKKDLLPKLIASKTNGEPFRLWIAACATGEEAYSVAMTIFEILEERNLQVPVQIFATDLSAATVKIARLVEYSEQAVATISAQRRERFFTKSGKVYHIHKRIRDMCVFAVHNILNDPPFSHIDFISCRNLMIYLDIVAQQKVISTFHYALNVGGHLMLGKSETVGSSIVQFSQVHKKYKIYLRKNIQGGQLLPDLFPRSQQKHSPFKNTTIKTTGSRQLPDKGFDNDINALLLTNYIPASVVINRNLEVLHFKGATEQYLKNPVGKASLNLLKMAAPEVALELRIAIPQIIKSGEIFSKKNIEVKRGKHTRVVNIEIVPLSFEWDEPLFMVVFTHSEISYIPASAGNSKNETIKDKRIKKLEKDLIDAQQNIILFTQEQESFTGELQTANEEVVSSNEELQSLNEELETSKEEIESSNEELITSNQELITRNQLLYDSHEYSEAVIQTIHEPLIVLDSDLRIRSVNNAFTRKFNLSEQDAVGTLLHQLGNKQWASRKLRKLLNSTIQKEQPVYDFELAAAFPDIGERILLLNAGRIVQKSSGVQLILLAIYDITDRVLLMQNENKELISAATETQRYNEKLETLVAERTVELTRSNKLLQENMEVLEKINEELQAFAFVSSHDLQEPLRKIQTFTGMIMDIDYMNLSETGKDYFHKIQAATMRMRTLIKDLITYSEVNSVEGSLKKTDLATIVNEVLKDLDDTILKKKAVINTDIQGVVNIIPFQLRQLMHNLLANAIKFAKPGTPPNIRIRSRIIKSCALNLHKSDNTKRPCCHISVSDNGIGFDEKYSQRIFSVFQKLHDKDEFEGSGIGLSIVKKIIQNHNGTITVKSNSGKGTTFHMYIPA